MSELGYGSPKDKPLPLSIMNKEIISYFMGSYVESKKRKTFIGNFINIFNYNVKNFLVAFTDENIVVGKLDRGNISKHDIVLPYSEIESFGYYNKSGNLEIVTDKNARYLIKVSKYELIHSMKHITDSLELKYLD